MVFLIHLSCFSVIYLNRFGLPITEEFSISFSYIFIYVTLLIGCIKGLYKADFFLSLLFLITIFLGFLSYLFGFTFKSLTSFALLLYIYLPFLFVPKKKHNPTKSFFSFFFPMLVILAICGITQFVVQFFYKPDWLFNFRQFLPDFLQNKNKMNTVIEFGGFYKSNGFFLLEPSGFSQFMTLGLYLSSLFKVPVLFFLLFFMALVFSFSGTGIILLLCTIVLSFFIFDFHRKVLILLISFLLIIGSAVQEDRLLLQRISEFQGGTTLQTTSAAARFINPFFAVKDEFADSVLRFFLGCGPGTYARQVRDFDAHDPVWGKLLYEYGFLGSFSLIAFLLFAINATQRDFGLTFLFFIQWLFLGGHLLSLDVVALYIIYFRLSVYG